MCLWRPCSVESPGRCRQACCSLPTAQHRRTAARLSTDNSARDRCSGLCIARTPPPFLRESVIFCWTHTEAPLVVSMLLSSGCCRCNRLPRGSVVPPSSSPFPEATPMLQWGVKDPAAAACGHSLSAPMCSVGRRTLNEPYIDILRVLDAHSRHSCPSSLAHLLFLTPNIFRPVFLPLPPLPPGSASLSLRRHPWQQHPSRRCIAHGYHAARKLP